MGAATETELQDLRQRLKSLSDQMASVRVSCEANFRQVRQEVGTVANQAQTAQAMLENIEEQTLEHHERLRDLEGLAVIPPVKVNDLQLIEQTIQEQFDESQKQAVDAHA